MPANGLRVNHYDFVALHSMWIIFLKGICVLERVEITLVLRHIYPSEKLSTSSEVPQNHNDLQSGNTPYSLNCNLKCRDIVSNLALCFRLTT